MRAILAAAVVLVASPARGAEDVAKVSGTLEGKKLRFPETGIPKGVKAVLGLLESCHDEGLYKAEELKKAEQGDHIRLVFAKPVKVTVMNETLDVSEVMLRRPLNTGVFWVRSGDGWRRFTKFEFKKEEPLAAWLREAQVQE